MERDSHISKLIRESGVISAPGSFTTEVMDKIEAVPVRKPYKPLIGRGGRILFILFVVGVVVVSIFYAEPTGSLFDSSGKIAVMDWQWPRLSFHLDFLSRINLSNALVSAVVAIFILVLSDAGLNRRRFIQ
ncbi:MAG: hypothetical protein KAS82_06775 [Bacteroidales bacterium]|nr:hypothetical protein [Bacteroidales bacterium]